MCEILNKCIHYYTTLYYYYCAYFIQPYAQVFFVSHFFVGTFSSCFVNLLLYFIILHSLDLDLVIFVQGVHLYILGEIEAEQVHVL